MVRGGDGLGSARGLPPSLNELRRTGKAPRYIWGQKMRRTPDHTTAIGREGCAAMEKQLGCVNMAALGGESLSEQSMNARAFRIVQ